jgi:hypothetical protein
MTTQIPPLPVDGQQMLSHVANFFQRYLVCTEDQRTILALWTLHAHCFAATPVTPYWYIRSRERESGKSDTETQSLPNHNWYIRSRERESGKTVCLELLRLLCMNPWFTCGCTPGRSALSSLQFSSFFLNKNSL